MILLSSDLPPARGGVARYNAAVLTALAPDITPIPARLTPWWPLMILRLLFSPSCRGGARGGATVSSPPTGMGSGRAWNNRVLIVSEVLPWGTVAWLSRKLGGPRYAVIVHGLDLRNAASIPRKRLLTRRVLRGAHRVIANSAYTALLAREFGAPPDRITVIPPPIGITPALALPAQTPDVRRTYNLEHARIILSVGRLIARKGFDTLIQAMAMVQKTHPRAVLAIIGDGPERQRLHALAQREQIAVRFLGALDDATTAAWYRACDLFALLPGAVLPLLRRGSERGWKLGARGGEKTVSPPAHDIEGFGIVYLEAAAFGKPSVGTQSGGVPEAVLDNETGLLVPPNDPAAAAAAITRLLADRDLANRLAITARTRSQEFTQEHFSHHLRTAIFSPSPRGGARGGGVTP